jgi:hypothetical protein
VSVPIFNSITEKPNGVGTIEFDIMMATIELSGYAVFQIKLES